MENLTPERRAELETNLKAVLADMAKAAQDAGRDPADVRLVAISKFHPAADIAAMAGAGQRVFGESYVQEALAKGDELHGLNVEWHFVGRLQTNKAKYVAGRFALVHSVDSLKLAQALHKKAQAMGATQPVLLQVNLASEAQKGGVAEDDALKLASAIYRDLDALRLRGLMIMPPAGDDPEEARPYFKALRNLRERMQDGLGAELPELSMGMTGDFRQAIAEGATLVRIGTRLFGKRPG